VLWLGSVLGLGLGSGLGVSVMAIVSYGGP